MNVFTLSYFFGPRFSYGKARSQLFSEIPTRYRDGMPRFNPQQGPEKLLVGVGIELEDLQSEESFFGPLKRIVEIFKH